MKYDATYILTKIAFHQTGTTKRKNHHLYFTYLRRNLNYLDATNSIFVRELNTQGASETSLLAQATKKRAKADAIFFFL